MLTFVFFFFIFLNFFFKKIFFLLFLFLFFFLFMKSMKNKIFMINNLLMMDKMNMSLIMLSFMIMSLMIFFYNNKKINYLNILLFFLFFTFLTKKMFFFFVFFELSLMPILLMILIYGFQPERLKASTYLLMYTLMGSIPLIMSFFLMFDFFNFLNWYKFFFMKENLLFWFYSEGYIYWLYLFFFMPFIIKLPVYGVHLWLPKAHVEASVESSVILASILLKIGGYGLLRISFFNFFELDYMKKLMIYFFFCFLIVSILCFRFKDLKIMIAYSSICHMSLLLSGLLCFNFYSLYGSMMLFLSHGFCSAGLFWMFKIFYLKTKTRNLIMKKSFLKIYSILCFIWFLMCLMNCSMPPSLNLIGELLIFFSINLKKKMMLLSFLSIFFKGLFCFLMYFFISYSKKNNFNNCKKKYIKKINVGMILMIYNFLMLFFYNLFFW